MSDYIATEYDIHNQVIRINLSHYEILAKKHNSIYESFLNDTMEVCLIERKKEDGAKEDYTTINYIEINLEDLKDLIISNRTSNGNT